MVDSTQILSDITHFNKYAKYIPKLKRRETYSETVERYLDMMIKRYPKLSADIIKYGKYIHQKKILPSMRAMQFAGKAIEKNETRIYNCGYLPVDDYRAFSEIMFLLLGGTGVGYSVQFHHVAQLPEITIPNKSQKYLIGDSIEGWSDAIRHLMAAYLGERKTKPLFDFSDIRQKGSRLVTAGGKAPGPEPLKKCLFLVETLLERKKAGERLTTLEVHDIVCYIADAVLAGGIRRAALISLFSADDEAMLTSKYGKWYEANPQRGRANNSAVLLRHRVKKDFFLNLWDKVKASNAGEPGIYFSNNADWGTNPCAEIALRPFQFCNLCEINASDIKDEDDFLHRSVAATLFGTLQAGFTNFHYLRPIWKETTEKDALIGVGMTGIASRKLEGLPIEKISKWLHGYNIQIAHKIGICPASRTATVKPSGTTSCILGTSSGIHAWHSEYYIRRMQCTKDEELYKYLIEKHPNLVDDYKMIENSAVIEIPMKAPKGAVLREYESAHNLLTRVSKYNEEWVKAGHISGDNTNNVSATITVKEDEWKDVGEWMWREREKFNGLSVLPFDGHSYEQTPFEAISKYKYDKMVSELKKVDLTKVLENEDLTSVSNELACAGGDGCEVF